MSEKMGGGSRLRTVAVKPTIGTDYSDPNVATAIIEDLGYGNKVAAQIAGVLLELRADGEAETKKVIATFRKVAGLTRKPNKKTTKKTV